MGYSVIIKRNAEKTLSRLDAKTQSIVAHWILDNLEGCENPRLVGDGKALVGTRGGWRWRVGSYRILGIIDDSKVIIEIFKIGHRSIVYRNL
jgi:mRNA interferase RelE/StbE